MNENNFFTQHKRLYNLLRGGTFLFVLLLWSGCSAERELSSFFERKPTEIESRAILNELSKVRENQHTANPLPELYLQPPSRLTVDNGVKLFYFTHHHPAGDLSFRSKDKRQEKQRHALAGVMKDLGFQVSSNPSTNQLIIHCASDGEADQAEAFLEQVDVPPIQVHIDCLILERFGDVTKDWETTLLIENLFGEGVTLGESKFPSPVFPGASLRETRRSEFGLDFGYWVNKNIPGHRVRAVIDVLESRGYLKILLNPTLETVNGKSATVTIRDNAPIERIVTAKDKNATTGNTITYTLTDYKWVADTLTVTPHVYSDGTIGLQTAITIGSKSKPEGVVQTSIITERSIQVSENRIQPGKSLIIGGMRKSENRSVVRGVPVLKDLPIVGVFFSSKDFEEKATEITFILTPSISSGSIPYAQAAQMIREKYATPEYDTSLDEVVSDPMGSGLYTELAEKQVKQSQVEQMTARVEAEDLYRKAQEQKRRALQARQEVKRFKQLLQELTDQLNQSQTQLQKTRELTQQEKDLTDQQRAQLAEAQKELEKAHQQVESAKQKIKESEAKAQQAQEKAGQLEQQADNAQKRAQELFRQQQELQQRQQENPKNSDSQGPVNTESNQSTETMSEVQR